MCINIEVSININLINNRALLSPQKCNKMKKKTLLSLVAVMLTLSSVMAQYQKNPALCLGETCNWNETTRKFTVNNLPTGIKQPWCAYVQDAMWAEYSDITVYNYVAGATTLVTMALPADAGDPKMGGRTGDGFFAMAMFGAANNLPKPKNEDCTYQYKAQIDDTKPKLYCSKFNATNNESIITLTGLDNNVPDNIFLFADDANFTNWAILTLTKDPSNPDRATCDASNITYYKTCPLGDSPIYPFPAKGKVYMSSDDKGGGVSGRGPNYCMKSFPVIASSLISVKANNVSVFPNPVSQNQEVEIKGSFASNANLMVYSLDGSEIKTVNNVVNSNGMKFNVGSLKPGMYLLKVQSNEKEFSSKLVIE
jgi:hypothetical protein